MNYEFTVIAHIRTDYPEKFGVPRQAGLVTGAPARIIFEKEYRRPEAVRGLEGFSHIWLLWVFSESLHPGSWSPTVRPPRLGGNKRVGVFASRSPNRPNPIGLSAVKLIAVDTESADGPVLIVDGADLMDGTPVLDIKPYLSYADSIEDAADGFAADQGDFAVDVDIPEDELAKVPENRRKALRSLLSQRPVPAYRDDPEHVYGLSFAGKNISFRLDGRRLTVIEISDL